MLSKLGLLARPGTVMVYCGSLPGGTDEMDFSAMVHLGIAAGARVVLDLQGPLLRHILGINESTLNLNAPPPAPPSRPFASIALSRLEVAQTFHNQSEIDDQTLLCTLGWLAQQSETVLVRLARHCALLIDAEHKNWIGHVDIEPGEIKSTVGSGDSLLAGLLDAQLRGMPADRALPFALATSIANAQAVALAGFDRSQVDFWLSRVQVRELPADAAAIL